MLWFIICHLVLLLLVVVHRPLHCVVACYGASFSPCTVIVCYGPLSLTLRYYYLLWCIILCLVLLLFVVVRHLCHALLLLLLWSIVLCLAMLMLVIVHHPCLTMLLLLFDVIHHSLPCITVSSLHTFYRYSPHFSLCCWCYLLWFIVPHLVLLFACWGDVLPPFLPCAGYGDWSMKCYVLSSKIKVGFFFFHSKVLLLCFDFAFFSLLMFLALFNLVFCFNFFF